MLIGLIAGNGRLPFRFVEWAKHSGRDFCVIGIKGEVDEKLKDCVPAENYREIYVSEVSKCVKCLKEKSAGELVMIGGVARAKLKFNLDLVKIIFRLLFIKNKHKGVFEILISIFEKSGLKVRSIQDFMPELLIGEGCLGSVKPSEDDLAAFQKNLGKILDYTRTGNGQAVIISKGEILAYENFKGTDNLIKRAGGGFMVKIMEPGQDKRADLPVVGTMTIETLAKYGLDGVIVEAGRAITDNTADTIKLADEKGIFVYGVKI